MIENPVGFTAKKALLYMEFVHQAYEQYFVSEKRDDHEFEVPDGYRHQWDIWGNDIEPVFEGTRVGKFVSMLLNPSRFGFAAVSHDGKQLVIAIRGTEGTHEWIEDLYGLGQEPWPDPQPVGMILRAVSFIYPTIFWTLPGEKKKITPTKEGMPDLNLPGLESCVITGHSLGACLMIPVAMASAHALPNELKPTVYSFGGGRIGDRSFASYFDNLVPDHYRIVNRLDVVPHVPPHRMLWLKSKKFWLRRSWVHYRFKHAGEKFPIGPRFSVRLVLAAVVKLRWSRAFFKSFLSSMSSVADDLAFYHSLKAYRKGLDDLEMKSASDIEAAE